MIRSCTLIIGNSIQEVAEAQAMVAQQQQQQQGGGQVAKSNEIEMTPEMLMKRTEFDSSKGSTVVPSAMVTAVDPTNDIPPLRTISQNERKCCGSSPDRFGESKERLRAQDQKQTAEMINQSKKK